MELAEYLRASSKYRRYKTRHVMYRPAPPLRQLVAVPLPDMIYPEPFSKAYMLAYSQIHLATWYDSIPAFISVYVRIAKFAGLRVRDAIVFI